MKHYWMFGLLLGACVVGEDQQGTTELQAQGTIKNNHPMANPLGTSTTYSTAGAVDLTNEFFQEFGTNGRHCGHCHKPAEGWTVSLDGINDAFDRTGGLDPIFRTNDGSNSPTADTSTEAARRAAYSMLLTRGTIRVGIGIPAGGEFELVEGGVDDPYGHASAAELSLFRRPLPSANLAFIPAVMWDGRVSEGSIHASLAAQSNGATQGHAEAPNEIPQSVRESIVAFETALFNAQTVTDGPGNLSSEGAKGSAQALASQVKVNGAFNLFDSWKNSTNAARRAVWRGQVLFNTAKRNPPFVGTGTCQGCHQAQNVGTNLVGATGLFFDVGTSHGSRRAADQPLYTLRRTSCAIHAASCATSPVGTVITTTDPGRALITGSWNDLNKFKVPSIRALAARAPYFHGGSANTLEEVVDFYEEALAFDFTDAQAADLVAFLKAL